MSVASKERHARLANIVKKLFPKVMQVILKTFANPRGLQVKYQQKHIPIEFTEDEISLMEKLPSIDDFSIELCYRILRYEIVLHEPSCKWGNYPLESDVEIGDDVQRILNATNDVISRKSDEISQLYYENFQKKTLEVLQRVDTHFALDTIQLYQKMQTSDIDTTDMLQELKLMQHVNVIQMVDEASENMERYSRISRVINDTFPNILRYIIRSIISVSNLYPLCLPHLQSFSSDQQTILTNANSSNSYDSMDITLIYKLLRQFSLIHQPTKGWGMYPDKQHIKMEDDVERIRCYRNQIVHRWNINIGKDEFESYFGKFRDVGNRMDLVWFRKTNYEREVIGHKTCCMDMRMQIKYKNILKHLEKIELQIDKGHIKFFWGESFDRTLKNMRCILKDEKAKGRRKVRVQIIFQNEEEDEKTIDSLNSLKDEINKEFSGIEFILATEGSIVLHIEILAEILETDDLLQSTLTVFLEKILEHVAITKTERMDMVLFPVEEFPQWNAYKTIGQPVYIEFDIDAELFKTKNKMVDHLGNISNVIFEHSSESGTNKDITATLIPVCFEDMPLQEKATAPAQTQQENTSTTEEPLNQAQTPVNKSLPVSVTLRQQLKMKKYENEKLSIASCIKTGNTLVFSDYNKNQLIICNADGTDMHHIALSYTPGDITMVNSNTVAVSCGLDRTILIINIYTRSVTSTINTSDLCCGISYNDNNLYVVTFESMIHVMDLTGTVLRKIRLLSDFINDITVDRDRLVCRDKTSIYCCSLDGKLIWKFKKDEFQKLNGVTTDHKMNTYVTYGKTNTVVVVSNDGKDSAEILTASNGLYDPSGIYFDKTENILLVCNRDNGKVFLFDIKMKSK